MKDWQIVELIYKSVADYYNVKWETIFMTGVERKIRCAVVLLLDNAFGSKAAIEVTGMSYRAYYAYLNLGNQYYHNSASVKAIVMETRYKLMQLLSYKHQSYRKYNAA